MKICFVKLFLRSYLVTKRFSFPTNFYTDGQNVCFVGVDTDAFMQLPYSLCKYERFYLNKFDIVCSSAVSFVDLNYDCDSNKK